MGPVSSPLLLFNFALISVAMTRWQESMLLDSQRNLGQLSSAPPVGGAGAANAMRAMNGSRSGISEVCKAFLFLLGAYSLATANKVRHRPLSKNAG